jgi:hypothetical protein
MNSQKKRTTPQILLMIGLCAASVAGIFFIQSCEPDNVSPEATGTTSHQEVYALSRTASIIDLSEAAGVSANDEFTISTEPKFGKLTRISGTLYRYVPQNFSGQDQFSITVLGRSSEHNQVSITVCGDSTTLPCEKLHAFEDSVSTPVNTPVKIHFLDNDRLCDVKKKDLKTSIYQKPQHGKATISGNIITYHPHRGFEGADELIYEISARGKGKSFGLVSILVGAQIDSCTAEANGDFFNISPGYSFLPVLHNDNLCGSDSITIIDGPRHGFAFNTISGGENGIEYVSDSSAIFLGDTLRYRVCSPIFSSCSDAEVVILPK